MQRSWVTMRGVFDEFDLLTALLYRPRWQREAACRGHDPAIFFPERGAHTWDEARAICSSCPVRPECQTFAFTSHERIGIWGGMSERQRRSARRSAA